MHIQIELNMDVVEELEAAGITQILIITEQKKRAIADHFDRDPELIRCLEEKGNHRINT